MLCVFHQLYSGVISLRNNNKENFGGELIVMHEFLISFS